jgi:hypothetical protein
MLRPKPQEVTDMEVLVHPLTDRVDIPPATPLPDLSSLDGFSEDDIRQNEAGVVSEVQRSRQLEDLTMQAITLGVFSLIPSGALIGNGHWFFALIIFIVPLALLLTAARPVLSDLQSGAVEMCEGDARIKIEGGGEDPRRYHLWIGGQTLSTDDEVAHVIKAGGPYRAFFLPRSHRLVSMTPLAGWHAAADALTGQGN